MWLPGSLPFATIPLYSCSFMYIYVSIFIPYAVANKFFSWEHCNCSKGCTDLIETIDMNVMEQLDRNE